LRPAREPAFNVPTAVLATLAVLAAIHLIRWLLPEDLDIEVLLRFAFIPARYDAASPYASDMLGGTGAEIWTFVTYAFLHGDLTHLAVNSIWMLAFGSAVAWRFGTARFLVFSAITAAAGAATHLALHFGDPTPVVGASAAISAHMAAATRFIFGSGGPLGVFRHSGRDAFSIPAEPLSQALRRPQVIAFLGVWFGTNILFGLGAVALIGEGSSVAWEAHIGGFLAGLLLFPAFDPAPRRRASAERLEGGGLPPPPDRGHDGGTGAAREP
jgi:membrane associated rhomboid family serine protease